MEVYIKERPYDYVSDYKNGWQWSAGDDFKFPVTIGKYPCFIKRFERKRPENITGWGLLKKLKATFEPGLPRIHDIVLSREAGKDIHYLFYECLEGDTLNNIIRDKEPVDAEKLAEDLFRGLGSIHKHGYWFSDFCEKNIFCRQDGRYSLVDLDSAQPVSAAPDIDMYGDRQYLALASKFLVHQAGCENFEPADISGVLLNYIQCMLLVLRIKLGVIEKKEDYRSAALYNQLPSMLDQLSPECKTMFRQLLERDEQAPDQQEVVRLKNILLQQVIRGEKASEESPKGETPVRHLDEQRETVRFPDRRPLAVHHSDGRTQSVRNPDGRSEPIHHPDGRPNDPTHHPDGRPNDPTRHPDGRSKMKIVDPPGNNMRKWALALLLLVVLIAGWVLLGKQSHTEVPVPLPDTPHINILPPADSNKKNIQPPVIDQDSIDRVKADSTRQAYEREQKIKRAREKADSIRKALLAAQLQTQQAQHAEQLQPPQLPQPPRPDLQKRLLDSLIVSNIEYHHGLLGLGHRRRLVMENRSGYLLEKVLVEIINPTLGRNEIMTLSQVKPHFKLILLDNLPGDSKIKGVARSVHLPTLQD